MTRVVDVIDLADLTVWNTDTDTTEVLRFCTGTGFITGKHDDTLFTIGEDAGAFDYTPQPAIAYLPYIQAVPKITRQLFDRGTTHGHSTAGFGYLDLVNENGQLDYLKNYGFDGRSYIGLFGDPRSNISTFSLRLSGIMAGIEYTEHTLRVKLRDVQLLAVVPLNGTIYLGDDPDDPDPDGLEGTDNDLAGKRKPKLYGLRTNFSPPCVNAPKLIFQINDGTVETPADMFDSGVALTTGTVYSDLAELLSTAPDPGESRTWKGDVDSGAYVRLGSSPTGEVTASCDEATSNANRRIARIVARMIEGATDLTVSTDDLTDFDDHAGSQGGYWSGTDEVILGAAVDQVLASIGAHWFGGKNGLIRIGWLADPMIGPVVGPFYQAQITDLQRITPSDAEGSTLIWSVTQHYAGLDTVLTGTQVAGSVSDARRAYLAHEYRSTTWDDEGVLFAHPSARTFEVFSAIYDQSQAGNEAKRVRNLRKEPREFFEMEIDGFDTDAVDDLTASLELGSLVRILGDDASGATAYPRYGIPMDQYYIIISLDTLPRQRAMKVGVWGPVDKRGGGVGS